jgi:8-amino-7-oxononanoate synthase
MFCSPPTKLAAQVLDHSRYFQERIRASLAASSIPQHVLSLPAHPRPQASPSEAQPPTPIIPLLTPRARALSAHLLERGLNARPISWPTVPRGMDRVRVCLHAGNTRVELDALVGAAIEWAVGIAQSEMTMRKGERGRTEGDVTNVRTNRSEGLQSKL